MRVPPPKESASPPRPGMKSQGAPPPKPKPSPSPKGKDGARLSKSQALAYAKALRQQSKPGAVDEAE